MVGGRLVLRGTTILIAAGAAGALLLGPVLAPGASAAPTAAPAAAPVTKDVSVAHGVLGASATSPGYPVWAHFADPPAHSTHDDALIKEFVRLVSSAKPGSTIQGTIHSATIESVGKALYEAQHDHGVTVRLVLDGKTGADDYGSDAMPWIRKLGTANYKICDTVKKDYHDFACISTENGGRMHAKFFTFSATEDPHHVMRTDVSFFGSPNFTKETGTDQFNNTVTVYGDKTVKAGLDADFADLFAGHHYDRNDYYDADHDRGYHPNPTGAAETYFSPENKDDTDTIVNRLNDLTPDTSCRVRIAQSFANDGRPKLLKLVQDLRAKGCKVWMVVGSVDESGKKVSERTDIGMDKSVYNALIDAGVSVHRRPDVHDKYFAVYGKFGTQYAYRVYTGSQNWSGRALSGSDELFVKLGAETGQSHPLFDAYYDHFNDAFNRGVPCSKSNWPCTDD